MPVEEVEDSWDFGSRIPEASSLQAQAGFREGDRFGPYEVLGALGAGGMGLVFHVRDPELNREFALKVLKVKSEERRARFLREGRLTAALRHPGIVRIHSAGEIEGQPYLLYEVVEGSLPLQDVIDKTPLDQRVEWVMDIARAVGHAHAQGVVHRDLKAENVLIDAQGQPRVIDFGLAFAEEADRLTRTGAMPGTPRCMAPEQFSGEQGDTSRVAPTVDVWALGVLLYRCLTEEYPFTGGTLLELAARVCNDDPNTPRVEASLRQVRAVCLCALRKDPQQRYPDANAFADALQRALVGEVPSPTTVRVAFVAMLAAGLGLAGLVTVIDMRSPQAQGLPTVDDTGSEVSQEHSLKAELSVAQLAWERRDFEAARVAYEELIKLRPQDPDFRAALAAAHYQGGSVEAGLGELQTAVELCVIADANRASDRLRAWARQGWIRFAGLGPREATHVFDPSPVDFARQLPNENANKNVTVTRLGALQGDANAKAKIASWIQKGKWLERDPQLAGRILQPLCWEGSPQAMVYAFQLLSTKNTDWDTDLPAAEYWLDKAAEAKHPSALYWVERYYKEKAEGVR